MSLRKTFKDHVSKSAFKKIDGELRLVGKFGQISILDNVFDIWFVSTPPLTSKKLTALLKKLPEELSYTRLDGEAYVQTPDLQVVLKLLPLCGIKRKRKVSDIDRKRLAKQLRRKQ